MSKECKHEKTREIWEDHYACGSVYYGRECVKCKKHLPDSPGWGSGPLDLGAYR